MTGLDYLPSLLLAPAIAALYWLAALTDSRTTAIYGYTTMAVLVVTSLSAAPLGDNIMLRSVGTPVAAAGSVPGRREPLQARLP